LDETVSPLGSPARRAIAVRPVPRIREEPGVRWAIANALLLLAMPVLTVAGTGVAVGDAVLVVLAGLTSAALPRAVAALTGVVAWAWATGFTENDYGTLTFSSGDLTRLGASALGAVLIARLYRGVSGRVRGTLVP
jgi:hypothetical protein